MEKIVERIHRDGQDNIRCYQFLHSLQQQANAQGSSGQGRRAAARSVSPAISIASSSGGCASSSGGCSQRKPPEDAEGLESKRAAIALRAEVAANMEELDRDAARASAGPIEVKVLKPEIEAAVSSI